MSRQDASELATRLGPQAEAICRHYLDAGHRQGIRQGIYWQVGEVRNMPGRSMFVRLKNSAKGPAGKWTDYVAPTAMLRICAWALSHRRLIASTQHNASALREIA